MAAFPAPVFRCFGYAVPVTIIFQASFIGYTFLLGKAGDFSHTEKLLENRFTQGFRTFHQGRQMTDGIKPFLKKILQFTFRLAEFRHFQINVSQLVVEYFHCFHIYQLDFMVIVVRIAVIKAKIQNANGVHSFQFIVPVPLGTLLPNRESRIIDTTILKKTLFSFLHLYQKTLSLFVHTIYIENSFSFFFVFTQMFGVQIGQILDFLLTRQQRIQKTDEQILVHLGSEQFLKSEIRIEIYISFLKSFQCHS